jgi:putative sigma-54 modulation protein
MQINFTGHHIEITPALHEFAVGKFEKLLRHFEKIGSINVVFSVEKLRHIAEATIHVTKNEFHAHSESEDLYSAIELLVEKLDRQLKKHKEKITDHRD